MADETTDAATEPVPEARYVLMRSWEGEGPVHNVKVYLNEGASMSLEDAKASLPAVNNWGDWQQVQAYDMAHIEATKNCPELFEEHWRSEHYVGDE